MLLYLQQISHLTEKMGLGQPIRRQQYQFHTVPCVRINTVRLTAHMDWIPSLLKHLAISRSAIGAVFATACVMYFGPRFAPYYVDSVPKEWAFVIVTVLAFSGFLLFTWAVSGAFRIVGRKFTSASEKISAQKLGQGEVNLLYALGKNPTDSLNLDHVNYEEINLSRLEVLNIVHSLEKKGLVSLNPYSASGLVSLTQSGMKRALEIQRASRTISA